MKTINTEFNAHFARAMAKHNAPENDTANNAGRVFNVTPGIQNRPLNKIEPKAVIAARAAYTRAMLELLNNR